MGSISAVRRIAAGVGATVLAVVMAVGVSPVAAGAATSHGKVALRLGYLPNVTHAADLVGIYGGFFAKDLGSQRRADDHGVQRRSRRRHRPARRPARRGVPRPQPRRLGVPGLPRPVPDRLGRSVGWRRIRRAAVHPHRQGPERQDRLVAAARQHPGRLAAVLAEVQGPETTVLGGGAVTIMPQPNSQIVTAFQANAIAGAWVPEPYVATLVADGGHVPRQRVGRCGRRGCSPRRCSS